ncbi:hypothetical protein VTH06DRAFT_8727 [Thermothelomyces fergusii]
MLSFRDKGAVFHYVLGVPLPLFLPGPRGGNKSGEEALDKTTDGPAKPGTEISLRTPHGLSFDWVDI